MKSGTQAMSMLSRVHTRVEYSSTPLVVLDSTQICNFSFFVVSNGRNVVPSTIWGILTTKTDYLTLLAFLILRPASHGKSGRCVILRQIKYAQMFLHHFVKIQPEYGDEQANAGRDG